MRRNFSGVTLVETLVVMVVMGLLLSLLLVALKRFTKNNSPINTTAARQRIAETLIQANKYVY